MEYSSRRAESRESHNRAKRDRSRDRYRHRRRGSDSDYKNGPSSGPSRTRRHKRSRSRSRRSPYERSVSRHQSRTPEKIVGNKLIPETSSLLTDNKNQNLLNESVISQNENPKVKRKSRWLGTVDDKVYVPGIPSIISSNLSAEQQEIYLLQLNIGEISTMLRSGNFNKLENFNERSPSPEPIYHSNGTRLNTREFRTRSKLEQERHNLVLRLKTLTPTYIPPPDYRPPTTRLTDKILIPQEEYPETNFVGMLIGPRGNTLKRLEQESGAKIIIRGRGSVKEGKTINKAGHPLPGENEPLHVYITATTPESLKSAVEKIKKTIKEAIEFPEDGNYLRKMQLRELAVLNGTLRDGVESRCTNCGAVDHKSWLCPDKPNITASILCNKCGSAGHIARDCIQEPVLQDDIEKPAEKINTDAEYLALMTELGEEPTKKGSFVTQKESNQKKTAKLFSMPPPKVKIAENSLTETGTYSTFNAIAPWNQTNIGSPQMALPWQMTNMQEPWSGNQYSWPNVHNYIAPVPPPPINSHNFFSTLPPPPPPPPKND